MRIPRFYLSTSLASGMTLPLDSSAFKHAVHVLRLKPGAALVLFNGQKEAFAATLVKMDKRTAWVQVQGVLPSEVESPLQVTLAQGISRGEKMDYTLQKAVELGITVIQPLFTERSGVDLTGERLARKTQHWRGVVTGACEQSGRNQLPELREPLSMTEWLTQQTDTFPFCRTGKPGQEGGDTEECLRLLLDPLAKQGLRGLTPPTGAVTLLVGPEGGLSPAEITLAQVAVGFISVRLGPRILRTETAGVAALAALQALWGDWD